MESNRIIPKGILFPFVLLTTLFFAWAVPNNLTDTMLAAFKRIMSISDSKTAWIQVVCYLLGYGCCAIPGALFIKRYTYKSGVMLGLGLYAFGALLFYPAMLCSEINIEFSFFMYLLAIFVLFAGLSVLETSTNSYVLAIGPENTATRRLNLSQAFNPFGAITGVVISQIFILSQLNMMTASERSQLPANELAAIQGQELNAVTTAYVVLGLVMLVLLVAIWLTKMPNLSEKGEKVEFGATFRRLIKNKNYVWGVVAQFFYVGAQIMCWTFIIQYGTRYFMSEGMEEKAAEVLSQQYNIVAMIIFCASRFICTFILRYLSPGLLLKVLAIAACFFTTGVIGFQDIWGMYCLVGVSACMSLMFPTIYGIALQGLGDDAKFGAAGLIMAILGGSVLPPVQASIIDCGTLLGMPAVNLSFILPFICFVVIVIYGHRSYCREKMRK